MENPQPIPNRKRLMKRVAIVGMVEVAIERTVMAAQRIRLRLNRRMGTVLRLF
jgi:hypothetical protein